MWNGACCLAVAKVGDWPDPAGLDAVVGSLPWLLLCSTEAGRDGVYVKG